MLASLLNLQRNLVVFDFETTTGDPRTARAVSLAMVIHKPDGTTKPYKTLINPECPIPRESSEIHKITDEIIATGCAKCWLPTAAHPHATCEAWQPIPLFNQLAANLHRGFSDSDYAGYNVKFDLRVMENELKRCGLQLDWSKGYILDAHRLWSVLRPRTLSDALREWCGKEIDGAHEATVDVDATTDVLAAQLVHQRDGQRVLPLTVKEVHELAFPKGSNEIDSERKFIFVNGVPCINFGKKAFGQPMSSKAGMDFLRWMSKSDFSPEIQKIVTRALAGDYPTQAIPATVESTDAVE